MNKKLCTGCAIKNRTDYFNLTGSHDGNPYNFESKFIYYYIYTPTTYTPNMSNSQHIIVAHLLALAEQSTIMQKHASALCSGKKMLYTAVNNRRSKFGKDIVCCGHSEAICVRRYLSCSFKGKSKQSLVLAGLRGNRKS